MKKTLITLLAILLCATGYAQSTSAICMNPKNVSVITDSPNSDGVRMIQTQHVTCSGFNPYITCYVYESGEIHWYLDTVLVFPYSFSLPEGGVLLFKFSDGSTMELHQSLSSYDTEDIVGTYVPSLKKIRHYMHGRYPITEEQLGQISNGAITKVRIEKSVEFLDYEYKKDKVATAILYEYKAVLKALETKKDIYSDF